MENLVRTAEHLERLRERREALRAVCARLLAASPGFVLEIGCGHGHFLTAFAARHPDRRCVGIDLSADRIERAERKRARAGLPNLHFLRAEARDFLAALPDEARPSAIYVLFPDPWPKRRHHKYRLLEPGFLGELARRSGRGARLYFRTDHEPYFAAVAAALAAGPDWRPLPAAPWPFELPTIFQQKAERYHSLAAERA
jgi:tRNA (guanine-N7-)-methyltransferase